MTDRIDGLVETAELEAPSSYSPPGFRLPLDLKQMGDPAHCRHRSGWHYVMSHMRSLARGSGMLLDDFVERSFQHADDRQVWQEPWVGIFHHPPGLPEWLDATAPPAEIFDSAEFRSSRPFLKGAVALSEHLGQWLRTTLECPVLVVKHPTEIPAYRFSPDLWRAQDRISLVQVGWYARNTRAIYQVPVSPNVRKIHLMQDRPWVVEAIRRTDAYSPLRDLDWHGEVEVMSELDNGEYDDLLSKSIIFNHYWDASASNTIIEAIARSTPVVVNRHPALCEYLGESYPLFFDEIGDVDAMIQDAGRVSETWAYLEELDKSWLAGAIFAKKIEKFVHDLHIAASG